MNWLKSFGALVLSLAMAQWSLAASVSVIQSANYFDVFYTPTAGREFAAWDLIVTPTSGGLLDPIQSKRFDDITLDGAALDTWANTVFSSFGAGNPSYIFTEYHPGQTFPPIPAQSPPLAGASPPNPDQLRWTIFSTDNEDGDLGPPYSPYHMARVMGTPGGVGNISIAFFEGDAQPAPGGTFNGIYRLGCDCPPIVQDDVRGTRPDRLFDYTFEVSDDGGPIDWEIVSFTGPTVPANYSLEPVTGEFLWDTTGVPGGGDHVYTLVVKATDSSSFFDHGTLTIIMPEPGTFVLAGLSLVGVTVFKRSRYRRKW